MGIGTTLVLGLGNILLKDDGVGVHAVRALEEGYSFSEGVELLDGGTKGLDLLPYVEGCERLLILDALEMDAPPGTVKVVEGDAISAVLSTKLTVHQIALPDLLFAARFMGVAPRESALVGVQPESLDMGLDMTDTLNGALGEFVEAALQRLKRWGIEYVPGNTVRDNKD